MDSRAERMVSNGQNVIGVGIADNTPGILVPALGPVQLHMLGVPVGISIDDYVVKAQVLAGIHDPDGNFATICYEYLALHSKPLIIVYAICKCITCDRIGEIKIGSRAGLLFDRNTFIFNLTGYFTRHALALKDRKCIIG